MIVVAYFGIENECLLKGWLDCYTMSGNTAPLGLITDRETPIPAFWPGEVRIPNITNLPFRARFPLIKADLLKAQAWLCYQRKCLVIDIDAFPMSSLNPLLDRVDRFAMAANARKRQYEEWPEMGLECSAGVMLMDSEDIFPRFWRHFINPRLINHPLKPFIHGQRCLTLALREMGGGEIPWRWNAARLNGQTAVYHKGGKGKEERLAAALDWLRRGQERSGHRAVLPSSGFCGPTPTARRALI